MSTSSSFVEIFLAELGNLGSAVSREVVFHHRIDSTSDDLKRRLLIGASPGAVVAADCQEAGRGRKDRQWHSPDEGNLYVSLAIDVGEPKEALLPLLPLVAGIAATDVIGRVTKAEPKLKWPNDVNVSGKKLAGILCEVPASISRPMVAVVGLGVNIAVSSFPVELSRIATSLACLADKGSPDLPSPALLAARWVGTLEQWIQKIRSGAKREIIDAWRKRGEPFGRRVRFDKIEGNTVDLSEDGRLIVLLDSGEQVVVVGGVVQYI